MFGRASRPANRQVDGAAGGSKVVSKRTRRMLRMWLQVVLAAVCIRLSSLQATEKDPIVNYAALETPFRMQKLNLVWDKARPKLHESKLKKLFSELKLQDKEELDLKRLKAENGDKQGLREAALRKKFNGIMYDYGLVTVQPTDDRTKAAQNDKNLFKDKKLQKLWEKAQKSGLTEEELIVLKNEFRHHEEKVQEFYRLKELEAHHAKEQNHLHENQPEIAAGADSASIKESYERLHRLALNSHPQQFSDPKANGLWQLAQEADFSTDELEMLRVELLHFQAQLDKVLHMEAEMQVVDARHGDTDKIPQKSDGRKRLDQKIAKHQARLEEMHKDLVHRIAARHQEL